MGTLVLLISVAVVFVAYITYGSWLAKKWGIDPSRKTPAHEFNDDVDYVPGQPPVVLGHHFASIAGAGPIVGPIAAAMFGWIPVLLWVWIGAIFFGGVHDFGAVYASIRTKGKTISEIIQQNIGKPEKQLFGTFAFLTLVLVVAAFINIVASTFESTPQAASASLFFMVVSILFGFMVHRRGLPLAVGTIVGVAFLFGCVALGMLYPIQLSKNMWLFILSIYIFIASVTPVWILLQPRDYLNSFLLYSMLAGAFIGVLLYRPGFEIAPFSGFVVKGNPLFPILFITVACGAISGFHSLVSSGTTSKQLDNEKDAKIVGYGSMLIESILAVIALITVAYVSSETSAGLGSPIVVFSTGVATFMTKIGIPFAVGKPFVALVISAFALTTLDTATRLGRFTLQETVESVLPKSPVVKNRYIATAIMVVLSVGLGLIDYGKVWPLFGSANQLLAALALLCIAAFLINRGKSARMVIIPMIFMFAATLTALILIIPKNIQSGNYALVTFAVLLFILAIVLVVRSFSILTGKAKIGNPEETSTV